jgi:protein-tyrosine phosphatase
VNGGEYLLIELPDYALPPTLEETFYSLRVAGMTPILTHPERNPTLQQDDARLKNWIRDGMLTQVTASSVMGLMGRTAQKMAERMLANRWVHFLATDAHNISTRAPKMRDARDHIAARYGEQYAQKLCTENPQAVFDNRHLPPQEPAQKIFESGEDELLNEEKPRGLLRRIFRR